MPATYSATSSLPLGFDSLATDDTGAPRDRTAPCPQRPVHNDGSLKDDFSALYAAWFDGVLRWTTELGVRSCDKHDVAQSVFLVVHRRLPDFDRKNIGGWLYRITANQVRDYRRQLWNRTFFKRPEPLLDTIPSPSPTPVSALETEEAGSVLTRALSGLSERTKATFLLFEVQGFSCEEIALLHQVVPNTVWARLRRAREKVVPRLLEWRQS